VADSKTPKYYPSGVGRSPSPYSFRGRGCCCGGVEASPICHCCAISTFHERVVSLWDPYQAMEPVADSGIAAFYSFDAPLLLLSARTCSGSAGPLFVAGMRLLLPRSLFVRGQYGGVMSMLAGYYILFSPSLISAWEVLLRRVCWPRISCSESAIIGRRRIATSLYWIFGRNARERSAFIYASYSYILFRIASDANIRSTGCRRSQDSRQRHARARAIGLLLAPFWELMHARSITPAHNLGGVIPDSTVMLLASRCSLIFFRCCTDLPARDIGVRNYVWTNRFLLPHCGCGRFGKATRETAGRSKP